MNIDLLQRNYGAASANSNRHKDLWIRAAAIFPDQLVDLLKYSGLGEIKIRSMSDFGSEDSGRALKDLFRKYGSDKGRSHNYHVLYSFILDQIGLNRQLRLLEIGIGTNKPDFVSTMGDNGTPGASLKSFKEYLPNAEIFGADIDRDILFFEDRIATAFVDQLNMISFERMHEEFASKKYDVIIDDGLHSLNANLNTLLFSLDRIKIGGWIIIEDIDKNKVPNWSVIDAILSTNPNFESFMVDTKMWSWLYVVRKVI